MSEVNEKLSEVVDSDTDISKRISLLNKDIFPEIVNQINNSISANRLSRLSKEEEPVPDHSRNLTEIRTRVGLLLEFNLASTIEEYLPDEHKATYGTSQAHADIVLRDRQYQPTIRLEVKALEDIAEEKAANYKDLVHSIDPNKDILAIFLWGWKEDEIDGVNHVYPKLYSLEAFRMKQIALSRDLLWMRNSNENLVDIGGPVLEKGSKDLKEEEGNMGKLTRIVDEAALDENPDLRSMLDFDELRRYAEYISYCQGTGILRASQYYIKDSGYEVVNQVNSLKYEKGETQYVLTATDDSGNPLLIYSRNRAVHSGSLVSDLSNQLKDELDKMDSEEGDFLIIENEKFKWTVGKISRNSEEIIDRGDNLFGDVIGRTPI